MEQPTVEEFALCAVASLFWAALAFAFLLDFTAAYIIGYTSQSNSGACKLEQNKHFGNMHAQQILIAAKVGFWDQSLLLQNIFSHKELI